MATAEYATALARFADMERAMQQGDAAAFAAARDDLLRMRQEEPVRLEREDLAYLPEQDGEVGACDLDASHFELSPEQTRVRDFLAPETPHRSLLLAHGVGVGKCHAPGTLLLMHDGRVKMVQDVVVGDRLMGDDSAPRTATSLARGRGRMYEILPKTGDRFVVNDQHILCLKWRGGHVVYELTVSDYLRLSQHAHDNLRLYRVPVQFAHAPVECDPYEAGYARCASGTPIPRSCLFNCRAIRSQALAGVMDAAATGAGRVRRDDDDVLFLARSIGWTVRVGAHGGLVLSEDATSPFVVRHHGVGDYFGFTLDGNCRYLMRDCTVTHNTCSALLVAERSQATRRAEQRDTRPLLLLPAHLKPNFFKEVVDVSKLKFTTYGLLASDDAPRHCLGSRYLQMIPDRFQLTREQLQSRVAKLLGAKFFQVLSHLEFANQVEKLEEHFARVEPDADRRALLLDGKLSALFSHRTIVVDEIHNLRLQSSDQDSKKVPPRLLRVLTAADNVKLLMMSATPMFNDAREIVFVVNLMLANEKRALLRKDDVFDGHGRLTRDGAGVLARALRGRVSYVRGQDPRRFPLRMLPLHDRDVMREAPVQDAYGRPIPESQRRALLGLALVVSRLRGPARDAYAGLGAPEDAQPEDSEPSHQMHAGLQVCNVAFPGGGHGNAGFAHAFRAYTRGTQARFAYRPGTPQFLAPHEIESYAPKIGAIVSRIKSSEGVVIVYSAYLLTGVVAVALALEHVGFVQYARGPMLEGAPGGGPRYMLITGEKSLCCDEADFATAMSPANADGGIVKVVLCTRKASEGLDMKFVREIHLLDPWFNMNRAEQVIGRGCRTCSHALLPANKRNVTVFMHVAVPLGAEDVESIDTRVYRIALIKQDVIDEVMDVIRNNSLEHAAGMHAREDRRIMVEQVTSQGAHVSVPVLLNRLVAPRRHARVQVEYVRRNIARVLSDAYVSLDSVADALGLDPEAAAHALQYLIAYEPRLGVVRAGDSYRMRPHVATEEDAPMPATEEDAREAADVYERMVHAPVLRLLDGIANVTPRVRSTAYDIFVDRLQGEDLESCAEHATAVRGDAYDSMTRGGVLLAKHGRVYLLDVSDESLKVLDEATRTFQKVSFLGDVIDDFAAIESDDGARKAGAVVRTRTQGMSLKLFVPSTRRMASCAAWDTAALLRTINETGLTLRTKPRKQALCEYAELALRLADAVYRPAIFYRIKHGQA